MGVILKALKALQTPSIGVVGLGFILLILYAPCSALAFSGGSMGGDDWSSSSDDEGGDSDGWTSSRSNDYVYSYLDLAWGVFLFFCVFVFKSLTSGTESKIESKKTSVIKLQVCLFGTARSMQRELERIAESTDTSTPKGWKLILKETISSLLRHQDSCVSFNSSIEVTETSNEAETLFNRLLGEERQKFDRETLSNVNGIKRKIATRPDENEVRNEYLVVTILVAVKREQTLPSPAINSRKDLRRVMKMLRSIPAPVTKAVRVLWSPQDENETLSEMEVRENYPLLIDLPLLR
ncbi:hypothetical protein ACHQM5_027141 [Ranunculus cassubicifolius]